MTDVIHFSEFSTLTACERKWWYRYGVASPEEAGHAAHLGTLLHVGTAQWLNRDGVELPTTWSSEEHSDTDSPGERVEHSLDEFNADVVAKARWLLARYAEHYGSEPPSHWNVIATEQWLTARTPWGTIAGTVDGLVEVDGELWLFERKSYGSKGRLNWVKVDPQLGVYDILVQANYGRPAFKIVFDGIYTYQWVPKQRTLAAITEELQESSNIAPGATKAQLKDLAKAIQANEPGIERPAADSFEQVEVDLTPDHRATTAAYLAAAVRRRSVLRVSQMDETLVSVGRQCDYCDFRDQCWNDLAGVEPFEFEVDDDEAEPV